ncbi:kinase-like domain-containing protein [Truncatella angustata]|uniref:non-specific serine/threonine protein kinase n=1 Tax=Truncatella angustata TaxID=152316 RepID=A0A9P8RKW7_9PEZI|nr:kinase-like domain-containing protein [Truncatella angustata]KAH6647716.1 kinase-like domain-containing protein [Truncatella angustata]
MADAASGWQTVLPSAHSRVERLDRAQLAVYERQALELWAKVDGDWSGCGKHTSDTTEAKKIHHKLKSTIVQTLGRGGQGEVEKLIYTHKSRSVVLARKRIKGVVDILREEANILERLCHDHIVRLIGTYGYHHRELYLLLWPAATRDLAGLLNDLDDLRHDGGDRTDILERLAELELYDTSAIDNPYAVKGFDSLHPSGCPLDYLRRSMGCLTGALKYCHDSGIRHLDLKPENILVSPGQVHLADFGISRDVQAQEHTMTYLEVGTKKWFAPERFSNSGGWSMKSGGDVYSLGLVFLNITTILYGAKQAKMMDILKQFDWKIKLEQLNAYLEDVRKLALVTQEFADESAHTFAPKHVVGLIRRMTSLDPGKRPDTAIVTEELSRLGGLEQIYHNTCCKASPRALTQLFDMNYAKVCGERDHLREDNERIRSHCVILKAAEETYHMRLQNQQEKHSRDWAVLTRHLEEAKQSNRDLEAQLQQSRRHRPGTQSHERSSISGGLTMQPPRQPHRSPRQGHSKPAVSTINAVSAPRNVSPAATHRPLPDMRKSTDSLSGYPLRSRTSGSRLPQPINPSTPIRSGTPSTPRDTNSTDSTMGSMSSSMFSHISRRTTSSGLSPNPSPSASKILPGPEACTAGQHGDSVAVALSQSKLPAPQLASQILVSDVVHDDASRYSDSVQDSASQADTEQSDLVGPFKAPSLPVAKSWAAIAGSKNGPANVIGAAVAGRKKRT